VRITPELTDAAIAQSLGARVERYRIEAGLTQAELSEQAGIGKRTLERIEAGRGAELVTLIRVLRALNALDGFERLLPELPPSPIEQLELRGRQRQRVAHPRGRRKATRRAEEVRGGEPTQPWTWGVPAVAEPAATRGARNIKRKT
jgi:transcriptional regulator with XRE-family HTH domain